MTSCSLRWVLVAMVPMKDHRGHVPQGDSGVAIWDHKKRLLCAERKLVQPRESAVSVCYLGNKELVCVCYLGNKELVCVCVWCVCVCVCGCVRPRLVDWIRIQSRLVSV